MTNPGPGGIHVRLADQGHEPVTFIEELRCRMPNPPATKALELPDGTPVIEIIRRAFQADGCCVEATHMILDATTYVLVYTFGPDPKPPARTQ